MERPTCAQKQEILVLFSRDEREKEVVSRVSTAHGTSNLYTRTQPKMCWRGKLFSPLAWIDCMPFGVEKQKPEGEEH